MEWEILSRIGEIRNAHIFLAGKCEEECHWLDLTYVGLLY